MIESASTVDATGWRSEVEQPVFYVGVDLGKAADYTAIAVLEHRRTFVHHVSGRRKQTGESFDVRHIERFALGLAYPAQAAMITEIVSRAPLQGAEVFLDRTGPGAAVSDIFEKMPVKLVPITITAGDGFKWSNGGYNVAKSLIVSTLDARLHTRELGFAKALHGADALSAEIKDFQQHVTAAGRYQYEARTGKHDDLVLAVGLALWGCCGRPKPAPPVFGTWSSKGINIMSQSDLRLSELNSSLGDMG
ncbi:hypothetical protein [Bradyrhizobium sp. LeoA1S1]